MLALVVVILLGAAGAGKTTIGRELAARHGWRFVDGDDHHTASAIAKMRRGAGLSDDERTPWLAALHALVATASARREGLAVACSALKQRYRDVLRDDLRGIRFVYLKTDASVLRQRLAQRQGHFAGAELLAGQLEALEEPTDAFTITLDATQRPDDIVRAIDYAFGL